MRGRTSQCHHSIHRPALLEFVYSWAMRSQKLCTVEGCGAEHVARGLCRKHYMRWDRHGDPQALMRSAPGSDLYERILAWPTELRGSCVLWTGQLNSYGYGSIERVTNGKREKPGVHRVVFEAVYRPLLPGEVVDHECHNQAAYSGDCLGGISCFHRRCINAEHMRAKTSQENCAASPLTGKALRG